MGGDATSIRREEPGKRYGALKRIVESLEADNARRSGKLTVVRSLPTLGGVDKLEPVSGGGDMDHAEEAFGELVVSSGDGAVDFQATEESFDVIAFFVERPVMFDLDPAI